MASMRLHLTSPFETDQWIRNSFAQLLLFDHGYTTLLIPWSFYEFVFTGLQQTITETKLVYIHSFIGILSLSSYYYFVKLHFGNGLSLFVLLLLSVIPVHIGLSRAHVGSQLISSIFYFGALACLYQYAQGGKKICKQLYFLATFFYIGSDNAFFLGLLLQFIYIHLVLGLSNWKNTFLLLKKIYFDFLSLVFIALPILIYIALAGAEYLVNHESGYLLRLVHKVYNQGPEFSLVKVPVWMLELFGPVAVVFLVSIPFSLVIRDKNEFREKFIFVWLIFIIYFVILNLSSRIERNYVIHLLMPVAVLSGYWLLRRPALAGLVVGLTLVYSLSVVYNLEIGFPTTKNYGSIDPQERNNDMGLKTLGHLVRSGQLALSKSTDGPVQRVALFMDRDEAFYYLGADLHSDEEEIRFSEMEKYPVFVLAYREEDTSPRNQAILAAVKALQLNPIGTINDGERVLIALFSNQPGTELKQYEVQNYNREFDRRYGSLNALPRLWLGHFGFKVKNVFHSYDSP